MTSKNDSTGRPARPASTNDDGAPRRRRRRRRRRPEGGQAASPQTPRNGSESNRADAKRRDDRSSKRGGDGARAETADGQPKRRRTRRKRPDGPAESPSAKPMAVQAPLDGPGAETFAELGLNERILRAVADAGYVRPTPIQCHGIPPVLEGRDVLGAAQTGTGKTAAFALPTIQRLAGTKHGPIRALVLAPTRELAAQIGESFETYSAADRLRTLVIFGGVSKVPQVRALRGTVDVLVATPGRLMDLMGEGHIDLRHVETFILDEADRMLDMGFIRDVKRIAGHLPDHRQTLMFSATMPPEIERLAKQLLDDPARIAVDPISSTREPISQSVIHVVDRAEKTRILLQLLKDDPMDRVLVFTRTKHGANRLTKKLVAAGHGAAAIHGNKSQGARTRALEGFRSGAIRVVVATDIAARGIDIDDLSHVVNYELPNIPESYVHRIGRTGRAGRSGVAIAFCAPEERPYLKAIEKLTKQKLSETRPS